MATNYVLLELHGSSFLYHGVVEADNGPTQAVRRFTDALTESGEPSEQTYIAVPVRNWNVIPRRVVVAAPRVEIGEVDAEDWLGDLDIVRRVAVDPGDAEALATSIEEEA